MLSDEEKQAIEELKNKKADYFMISNLTGKTLVNLIEKQSKEIEELKRENKEIREWKYVIDNPIDLKKLSELDIIKIFGKSYIAKDLIKARIKELEEYLYKGNIKDDFLMIRIKAEIQALQSLLEKE